MVKSVYCRISIGVMVALFSGLASEAFAQSYQVQVQEGRLNARASGSGRGEIVERLANGTTLQIVGQPNRRGYVEVRLPGSNDRAFVAYRYLKATTAAPTQPPEPSLPPSSRVRHVPIGFFMPGMPSGPRPSQPPVVEPSIPLSPPARREPPVDDRQPLPDSDQPSRPGQVTRTDGPGGRMQDCGIPPGPIAYNIGSDSGSGVSCQAKSVVVGFRGSLSSVKKRGQVAMGYINPRLENMREARRFGGSFYHKKDGWNEPVYHDYGSQAAVNYIASQVNHWKDEGAKIGQSCVAVDVDNCDVVGTENYGKVLDTIDRLNRERPNVQIRVLIKNPQLANCGRYLKRSVAIGAFMEEISPDEVSQVTSMRPNPDQILVFAQGSDRNGEHASLSSIASRSLPNSTVSFDVGRKNKKGKWLYRKGSYNEINQCTYQPGGSSARQQVARSEGGAVR
ncbi:MAG: hypothetical protein AB7F86_18900 [Bdellovibrionales bacterium]